MCLAESTELFNLADETDVFAWDEDLKILIDTLKHSCNLTIVRFENNRIYYFLKLCVDGEAKVGKEKNWQRLKQKLWDVLIDTDLNLMDIFPLCAEKLTGNYPH